MKECPYTLSQSLIDPRTNNDILFTHESAVALSHNFHESVDTPLINSAHTKAEIHVDDDQCTSYACREFNISNVGT